MLTLLLVFVLLFLGTLPTIILWIMVAVITPAKIEVSPSKRLLISLGLSVVVAAVYGLELEGGALSAVVYTSVASFIISFVSIPFYLLYWVIMLRRERNA